MKWQSHTRALVCPFEKAERSLEVFYIETFTYVCTIFRFFNSGNNNDYCKTYNHVNVQLVRNYQNIDRLKSILTIFVEKYIGYVHWNLSENFRYLNKVKEHVPVSSELLSLSCFYIKM